MLSDRDIQLFRESLLGWFDVQKRDLPWRRTRDPYLILASEVMLQQTRVAAAVGYFERFRERFPGFKELAEAPEHEVLACWAGLGYYYRARNLHRAAKLIAERGQFPSNYEAIRNLPGVGDYTAAAVASIAFDQPHASVDGNAIRVLSRVFDEAADAASLQGRKQFSALAAQLLDIPRSGDFNQAVMELGATVCLPSNPQCLLCPVMTWCRAHARGSQHERPVKRARIKTVQESRTVYWIEDGEQLLVWQRPPDKSLMPGFWELPEHEQLRKIENLSRIGRFRHGITFHDYRFEVCAAAVPDEIGCCEWIKLTELNTIPVSTILKKARRLVEKHRQGRER